MTRLTGTQVERFARSAGLGISRKPSGAIEMVMPHTTQTIQVDSLREARAFILGWVERAGAEKKRWV